MNIGSKCCSYHFHKVTSQEIQKGKNELKRELQVLFCKARKVEEAKIVIGNQKKKEKKKEPVDFFIFQILPQSTMIEYINP